MARPSQNIDQTLLASGRELYPQHGFAGLSVRQICEHAGANVGMFHYHFQSKNNYVTVLLQGLYDEVFEQLAAQAAQQGSALERLRAALCLLGRLIRQHGNWISRVWADAGLGEEVARQFLQRNAPRHVGLLMALLEQATEAGELPPSAPMQRFGFLMGAVLTPMILLPAAMQFQLLPTQLAASVDADVFSDAAIADRVNRALSALALPATPLAASQRPTP
ncbi:TetR/AcrR family transcriptional regulator [Pseudoduganella danionis]|uniref:TetR/AcrR family transcriptional regulator n=1 Tax=Pseudoduganella danionis TaxID=1890295 RepID=UPI0035AE4D37